jgi:acid phosphatase type 7
MRLKFLLITIAVLGLLGTTYLNNKTRSYLMQEDKIPSQNINIYQPKVVIAVGDIACDPSDKNLGKSDLCQMEATYNIAAKKNPEAVLTLGDLQYNDGSLDKFQSVYDKSWGKFKSSTYPTPGNHEYITSQASGYFDYFNGINSLTGRGGERTQGYYSFNIGSWHLVSLNSNCSAVDGCNEGSPQYLWLQKDLERNSRKCTLAFWHHPHFTSGNYAYDYSTQDRSVSFWHLLDKSSADVILNGHDHIYERFAKQDSNGSKAMDGIRQFTVGTGGKTLYEIKNRHSNSEVVDNKNYGVLVLKLYLQAYRWEFITGDNKVIDSGSSRCSV